MPILAAGRCADQAPEPRKPGPAGVRIITHSWALCLDMWRLRACTSSWSRTKRASPNPCGAVWTAGTLNPAGTFTGPVKPIRPIDAAKRDVVTDEDWGLLSFVRQAKNPSGGKVYFRTLPVERFGRNHGEDINVVGDMKIKRLIADQIGPKAAGSPSAPGAAPSSPDAAPPPSSPPSSPAPADGGGVPCAD
ncbi:hypothetical protein ACFCZ1_24595 [Streptomyces sp. NPDC056224]|uniref:hypothetical protein n=1 Tax=Streptomyces sp. NPDC056224 TaxID=3345750 RepID=UPI0035E3B1C6